VRSYFAVRRDAGLEAALARDTNDLPRKGAKKAGSLNPEDLPEKLLGALLALYDHYATLFPAWMENFGKVGRDTPPVFIVVCQNTSHSSCSSTRLRTHKQDSPRPEM